MPEHTAHASIPMIRVKDFAKCEPSQSTDNNHQRHASNDTKIDPDPSVLPVDIEIISLSSNEDIPPVARPPPPPSSSSSSKQPVQKTPAKRKPKRLKSEATTPSKRTPKPPSTYKFHKINEYFSAPKKIECKLPNCIVKNPISSSNFLNLFRNRYAVDQWKCGQIAHKSTTVEQ